MYTVASPDPGPRDGGQLPNPNKCNSTLTSGTRGEIPNPNEWNKWERSPHLYIYIYLEYIYIYLEYNIQVLAIEMTGRKP